MTTQEEQIAAIRKALGYAPSVPIPERSSFEDGGFALVAQERERIKKACDEFEQKLISEGAPLAVRKFQLGGMYEYLNAQLEQAIKDGKFDAKVTPEALEKSKAQGPIPVEDIGAGVDLKSGNMPDNPILSIVKNWNARKEEMLKRESGPGRVIGQNAKRER